jgi:hypothetical protein
VPYQLRAKKIAISFAFSCLITGGPALAQLNTTSTLPNSEPSSDAVKTTGLKPDEFKPTELAQSTSAGNISAVAAVAATTGKKHKGELLITDSLWGNLILDLAYQRDDKLHSLGKQLGLVNFGTILGITGIAGGTLAQGIIALSVLNPPPPKSDSYLPGSIGIGMSGLTMIALGLRTGASRVILAKIRKRQLEIKHHVESVLAQVEQSNGQSPTARSALLTLIGERATNEWLQLWRSSNKLAMSGEPTDNPLPKVSFSESVLKQSVKVSSSDL